MDDTHEHIRDIEQRLKQVEQQIAVLPTKDDISAIVQHAMLDAIKSLGRLSKTALVTIAIIIGSLGVITGGFKWLLGVLGFTYIGK